MSQESDDYPALMDLNRGYFNQDFEVLISRDPDEVVRVFREENTPDCVEETVRDIQRFLSVYGKNEAELTSAFERIFTPETDFYNMKGRTTREGLEKVIEILSNPRKRP